MKQLKSGGLVCVRPCPAESARDKKTERARLAGVASDDRARQLDEKMGLREAVAAELQEAKDAKARANKELEVKLEAKENSRTAFKISTAFGGNLMNVKKAKVGRCSLTLCRPTLA